VSAVSLKLFAHPLSSFSWKVLIALYENETPFELITVDGTTHADLLRAWPIGKFPVLVDRARGETVPESSAIIDYLDRYHPGPVRFTPADPDLAWRVRLLDRFFDLHIHQPMQKIVGDRIRAAGQKDPFGVEEARGALAKAYPVVEARIGLGTWLCGEAFGLADCAAAPAIYYANKVQPLGDEHAAAKGYLARLTARPSFARVLEEAEPFFRFFPQE
jgi:glutathione S-transferase